MHPMISTKFSSGSVDNFVNHFLPGRSLRRYTNFNPDHVSSTAQIFTSTRPASSPILCTFANVRSVATPELFFGHAIQIIPFDTSFLASLAKSRARVRSEVTNKRMMSMELLIRFTRPTLSGSSPKVALKSSGAFTNATRDPSLIPSFFANGVEEYPAMLLPESENLPPGKPD